MDNKRREAYINLIYELLNSPNGEAEKILQTNQELVDEGLLEIMELCAQKLAENEDQNAQNAANFLRHLRSQLAELLEISEFSPSTHYSSAEYLNFLMEVLQATVGSNGDSKVVYPLLEQNLDKLDENFADILRNWATAKFSEEEADVAESLAIYIGNFSNCIQQFPLGNKANNIEISIAGYEVVRKVLTYESHRENWAAIQNNLGVAYRERIIGDKAENIESAIAAYQQALLVRTPTDLPMDWASTQNNLGTAYWERIRGDKAQNLESAITAYQQALLVRTQTDFPMDWASTQNNLGAAYRDRIRGDKAENIESAIAAFRQALQVRTQTNFPIEWAATQNNLGTAYWERIAGDKAENIELVIAAYQQALQVHTQTDFPMDWATTQNNLGTAYRDRIRGDKAENIESAIAAYQQALLVRTQTDFPIEWAATQNNLGVAYSDRIRGNKAENIESAIGAFRQALQVRTQTNFPMDWAMTQNNLGIAYRDRIRGNKAENIESTIAAYQQALQVRTQTDFPIDWARTQNNLGNAYNDRIRGDKAQNIESAIAAFQQALLVSTQTDFPIDWARTQNNLGIAYSDRIRGDKAENIEAAIAALQQALQVRTQTDFPMDWARTQNNLGNAYIERIRGDKAENLELAIAAFQQAKLVYTQKDFPMDWARTQNSVGIAYSDRIRGEKAQNLEAAIAAYEQALQVYTQTDFPIDWAGTQNNLGNAYRKRIRGDKAENIESAIAAFQQAKLVYTQRNFPMDWARAQNNLGNAYIERIRGDKAQNLESAIVAFQQAKLVYTKTDFPMDWARTQNNLGIAYSDRIRGDKAENLESAITAFQQALQVRTLKANLIDHLQTTNNLGNLYFDNQNWQLAAENYEKAITAVELSRSWATTDDRRQEIIAEAISVYHNQVQTYINLEQWDKAIETVERSKARNLVELLVKRELYPKGNVPQGIIAQLDQLRPKIPSLERQLQVVINQLSGNIDNKQQQRSSLETSQKILEQELQQSRQQLDEVLNQIEPFDSSFNLTERVEVIPFSHIQNLVNQDTVIIEWYLTKEKILTFVITESFKIKVRSSATTDLKALNNWLDEYLQDYNQPIKKHWSDNLPSRLQQLAEILHLEEILKQLPDNCQQLILVPHQLLHLLPLHALPLPNQPDKCLLDKFPQGVRYSPSCQLLQLTENRERSNFSNFFGVQNPTQNLPYASLQVEVIRQHFNSTEVLVETAATKTAFIDDESYYKKWLDDTHCLHFACHGKFNEESPLESCLKLANEEPLTLGEIFGLNIEQCRLVTLSACETGLTDRQSIGDEYIGLPSGFLFAGTPSVINSLWQVDELATAFLTIKFYKNLEKYPQRGPGEVAIALNQAQIWLRDLTHEDFEKFLNQFWPQIEKIWTSLSKGKRKIAEKSLEKLRDRQPRPFASPFSWSGFIATGH